MTDDTKRVRWEEPIDLVIHGILGVIALVVYAVTLTPTVPFWDSGEFIATSYILGIPHPPGTPLYVILGRVFTLFPIASIAERVNSLSALPSAAAVSLTYLVTARILAGCGRPFGNDATWPPRPTWIGRFGGVMAALVMAFSSTYWFNAVEAEVYALSSMVMTLSVYLMLKWRDLRHQGGQASRNSSNVVVLVFYMLALSIAFHMGAFIVFLPLVLFFLSDYYKDLGDQRFVLSAILIVVLSFFLGFDKARFIITGIVILSLMFLNKDIVGGRNFVSLAVGIGLLAVGGVLMAKMGPLVGTILTVLLAGAVFWTGHDTLVRNNLGFWVAMVFVLGLSVHLFLPIRAALDPAINEADPSSLENFWLVLSRDQYKPGPPWTFRGGVNVEGWDHLELQTKFVTHFWRYWRPQYDMGVSLLWAIPFVLGVWGGILNMVRSRRTFLLVAFIILVTSVGLIWHLNFKEDEVRDRDYFFVALFHFFCIWIGMGAAGFVYLVRESLAPGPVRKAVAYGTAALLLLLPLGQLRAGWFEHNRSGFWVARDYAYNMLAGLEPNAILFTNGDNDTFPLWYLQEVEGVRRDIRVANLSLLNTEWYIWQLRDQEPEVPIVWTDDQIATIYDYLETLYTGRPLPGEIRAHWPDAELRAGVRLLQEYLDRSQEASGRLVPPSIKDFAVHHIVRANAWQRPVYIAVTVPDLMGFQDQNRLVMEGLAWRIMPEPVGPGEDVDAPKLEKNLLETFKWRGLLDETGDLDHTVYRDKNSMKLAQNYAAAFVRLANYYDFAARARLAEGDEAGAEELTRRAIAAVRQAQVFREGFSPYSIAAGMFLERMGELEAADSVFTDLMAEIEASMDVDPDLVQYLWELQYRRAKVRYDLERYQEALDDFAAFRQVADQYWDGWEGMAKSYAALGQSEQALAVIDDWLTRHPQHTEALTLRNELGGPPAPSNP